MVSKERKEEREKERGKGYSGRNVQKAASQPTAGGLFIWCSHAGKEEPSQL